MSVLLSGILLALKTRKIGGFTLKEILNTVLVLAVLGCIGYTAKSAYDWAYDRGMAAENQRLTPVMEKLTLERNVAIKELEDYKKSYAEWKREEEARQRAVEEANQRALKEIEEQLEAEKRRRALVEREIHEIEKYIPADSDSNLMLPSGFVWLFNLSLQGTTDSATATSQDPFSLPGDAQAPSGTRLAPFAEIATRNNLECVERGVVIESWQKWYETLIQSNHAAIELKEVPISPSQ